MMNDQWMNAQTPEPVALLFAVLCHLQMSTIAVWSPDRPSQNTSNISSCTDRTHTDFNNTPPTESKYLLATQRASVHWGVEDDKADNRNSVHYHEAATGYRLCQHLNFDTWTTMWITIVCYVVTDTTILMMLLLSAVVCNECILNRYLVR